MTDIQHNISNLLQSLPANVCLVAVSKTKPNTAIEEVYAMGQRHFGENKVQELTTKYEALPKDIKWHMIGHLQSNKVKYIAPFIHLIHSVDSAKLLAEINKQGEKHGRVINCLLQVHIAEEEHKFGFDFREITDFLKSSELEKMTFVKITGLMGMATFTDDDDVIKKEFDSLNTLYKQLCVQNNPSNVDLNTLSMGMSGDYQLAISCGSTMIRVGSSIFGERNYTN